MIDSILDSTKKMIGLDPEYTAFDHDIITFTNAAFSTLHQIGVGPSEGFMIFGPEELWSTYLEGDMRNNNIMSYVYLRVRMLYDPPTTQYLVTAMERQISELEWRINVAADKTFRSPLAPVDEPDPLIVASPEAIEPEDPVTGQIWVKY